jgi:hypothetical protein
MLGTVRLQHGLVRRVLLDRALPVVARNEASEV